jgi:GR25 family glycosyltransferase involved in LPS biosynthesis
MGSGSFFLIHCRACSSRLPAASAALRTVCKNFTIVRPWDASNIPYEQFEHEGAVALLWRERLPRIANILIENAYNSQVRSENSGILLKQVEYNAILPWMHYRRLSAGEISVLFKHYFALSSIACGEQEWGLIAEDDILKTTNTEHDFEQCMSLFRSYGADYMDLAGGCDLHPEITWPNSNAQVVVPPRTRTNACYVISKKFASRLVENFWPLAFPIDWHIQYLMTLFPETKCLWALYPPFIHGSEAGHYNSWRINV